MLFRSLLPGFGELLGLGVAGAGRFAIADADQQTVGGGPFLKLSRGGQQAWPVIVRSRSIVATRPNPVGLRRHPCQFRGHVRAEPLTQGAKWNQDVLKTIDRERHPQPVQHLHQKNRTGEGRLKFSTRSHRPGQVHKKTHGQFPSVGDIPAAPETLVAARVGLESGRGPHIETETAGMASFLTEASPWNQRLFNAPDKPRYLGFQPFASGFIIGLGARATGA